MKPIWEHVGEAGDHMGHHLHADRMQDVHCLECDCVLSDDEAGEAWPKIYEDARKLERERLERGESPNPNLTSPEEALKYGWVINGREVRRLA
jgi:hypothetical protein